MFRRDHCFCILCALMGLVLAWLLGFHAVPDASAQGKPAPSRPASFINDVAPILKENCFACHDAKKRKGKLEMTSYATFRKGGSKEDPVVAGKPGESLIIDLLTRKGAGRMPPREAGEPLPKEKVDIIARWIQEGARLDAGLNPKAELMRELRIRWRPPVPPTAYKFPANINALVFTPDNKKVIVGGYHEVTVWDAATGKLEKRVYTRSERAYTMLFLPDGKLAIAGGLPGQEGNVRIYNIAAPGKMENGVAILDGVNDRNVFIAELLDTDDTVFALALAPGGKKIASGGVDRLVRVWDISAGYTQAKLEHAIENHADWVFGVMFSPDGKKLVTASRDKTAKLWDLEAKESVLTFPDHQNTVYDVAIMKDGKTGISVSEDKNIRYWHTTDQSKQLGKQIRVSGGHGKGVFKVAYHDDPKVPLLATCSADGTVRLWNAANGAALKTLTGFSDWVYAVALSPDGKLVAGAGQGGEVRVWKTADGALVKAFNASPGYLPPTKVASPK
jgi:WD40 repeat protein